MTTTSATHRSRSCQESELASPGRTNRLSAAVIGGGRIAEQHLRTLLAMETVDIAGICDLSPALARFTAERFGVGGWFTDHREMLDRCGAGIVHVLTPPATHERIVRDCLADDRHVIVEKPIALSNEVFTSLWHDASARGLRLVENHNYRFNKPILQMDQAIASGRIGTVEEVEVRMVLGIRRGGRYADENLPHPSHQLPAGVIHEFVSHLSYLLLHFMPKSDPDTFDSIRATWRNQGGGDLFKYDNLDATIIAGQVHGRIRFASHQWPDCLMVQVRGSAGVATAELFHPMTQVTTRRAAGEHLTPLLNAMAEARARVFSGIGSIRQKLRNQSAYEGLERFLHRTYEALRRDDEPPVTFDQMDRTTRLIDAMLALENRA